jgi:hypothetical protein
MRLSAWSTGVGVLMIAFPMSMRYVLADTSTAKPIASDVDSARVSDLSLDSIAAPIRSIHSSPGQPFSTVALPKTTKAKLPRGSLFHPKAPNVHTRPKKKKSSFWPFGRK